MIRKGIPGCLEITENLLNRQTYAGRTGYDKPSSPGRGQPWVRRSVPCAGKTIEHYSDLLHAGGDKLQRIYTRLSESVRFDILILFFCNAICAGDNLMSFFFLYFISFLCYTCFLWCVPFYYF